MPFFIELLKGLSSLINLKKGHMFSVSNFFSYFFYFKFASLLMRICAWFKLLEINNQNAVYTQVSRGNVFTCTSVRAAILKNLKD